MLKINQFYWQLYKDSPEGKKTIEKFERASQEDFSIEESVSLLKEYNPVWFLNVNEVETASYFESAYNVIGNWIFDKSKSSRLNAEEMISMRFNGDYENAICLIAEMSFYLYKKILPISFHTCIYFGITISDRYLKIMTWILWKFRGKQISKIGACIISTSAMH
jgi:hypothetical protein